MLVAALTRGQDIAALTAADWDRLLPRARVARLLPRLAAIAEDTGCLRTPSRVQAQLIAATVLGESHTRSMLWEIGRVRRSLAPLGVPVLLLKGAAYLAAGLPSARGRLASDVDIMVPVEALAAVEAALLAAGWRFDKPDLYDQRYYRTWMHELPPLRHRMRRTVLDVHHAILPPTSRLRPDREELWRAARPLTSPFLMLAPMDMVLHGTAHLFQDGDLDTRLRDLLDIHDLLERFGRDPSFWPSLVGRARALDLARPLYYALRYSRRLLGTPVPATVEADLDAAAPPAIVRGLMDRLVPRVLMPSGAHSKARGRGHATKLLYIRSHWLRMPPLMLGSHLARKAVLRVKAG
jgi:hypothetical protein